MVSPLPGADYLRPPETLGTREEVLSRMKELIDGFDNQQEPESKEARMERHIKRRHEAEVHFHNAQAATFPRFVAIGPRQPAQKQEYVWTGRYGHVRQD